jgi:hypothetical protein
METKSAVLSGPCTCYRFWQLLTAMRNAAEWGRQRAEFAFSKHIDECPACQWWHSQPQPEVE